MTPRAFRHVVLLIMLGQVVISTGQVELTSDAGPRPGNRTGAFTDRRYPVRVYDFVRTYPTDGYEFRRSGGGRGMRWPNPRMRSGSDTPAIRRPVAQNFYRIYVYDSPSFHLNHFLPTQLQGEFSTRTKFVPWQGSPINGSNFVEGRRASLESKPDKFDSLHQSNEERFESRRAGHETKKVINNQTARAFGDIPGIINISNVSTLARAGDASDKLRNDNAGSEHIMVIKSETINVGDELDKTAKKVLGVAPETLRAESTTEDRAPKQNIQSESLRREEEPIKEPLQEKGMNELSRTYYDESLHIIADNFTQNMRNMMEAKRRNHAEVPGPALERTTESAPFDSHRSYDTAEMSIARTEGPKEAPSSEEIDFRAGNLNSGEVGNRTESAGGAPMVLPSANVPQTTPDGEFARAAGDRALIGSATRSEDEKTNREDVRSGEDDKMAALEENDRYLTEGARSGFNSARGFESVEGLEGRNATERRESENPEMGYFSDGKVPHIATLEARYQQHSGSGEP